MSDGSGRIKTSYVSELLSQLSHERGKRDSLHCTQRKHCSPEGQKTGEHAEVLRHLVALGMLYGAPPWSLSLRPWVMVISFPLMGGGHHKEFAVGERICDLFGNR